MANRSYKALAAGTGWLKNIDELAVSAEDGLTQADLTAAENQAAREIDSFFSKFYVIETWESDVPPAIAVIANMLGSSVALLMAFNRDGTGSADIATWLQAEARRLMQSLRYSGLLDSNDDYMLGVDSSQAQGVARIKNP